ARGLKIGAHALGTDLDSLKKGGEERKSLSSRYRQLRDGMPFCLPRPSIALMVVHETLGEQRGIGTYYASQRSDVFRRLRVTFVWHRDAAYSLRQRWLAEFANFIALEVIDFVANAIGCAG